MEQVNQVHPRIAVSGLCFLDLAVPDAIEVIAGLGVRKTSMTASKLREAGAEAVVHASRRQGVSVVTATGFLGLDLSTEATVEEGLRRSREDIDLAAAVGATSVYGLTGRRVMPEWTAQVDAYAEAAGTLVEYAAAKNVTLAIEPTNWLYADLNFVHSFHDAALLASETGLGVCLDLFHVWAEAELQEDIRKFVDRISHVQLSDMAVGARALPCRVVPGEGDVQIAAVVRWLLDAGYEGVFDVELSGPRIDEVGRRESASQAVAWLDKLLVELGV